MSGVRDGSVLAELHERSRRRKELLFPSGEAQALEAILSELVDGAPTR